MGKTAFALNVAMQSAMKYGSKVLIFSMEMSREQLGRDCSPWNPGSICKNLRRAKWSKGTGNLYPMRRRGFPKLTFTLTILEGLQVMEMKSKCRRMKTEKGLDMVIIDYLQLMSVEGRVESRQQEITTLFGMS